MASDEVESSALFSVKLELELVWAPARSGLAGPTKGWQALCLV